MSSAVDEWFVQHILIHEAALVAYLRRCWPNPDDVHDLRQEIYARVYESASRRLPDIPRAFLFSTANHLVTDRIRRSRVVSIEAVGDPDSLLVLVDECTPERWMGGRQLLARLVHAFDRLPDRCREVVWLRRVQELSQREVAVQLGISEKTVEKHMAKGVRLLADYFHGSTTSPLPTPVKALKSTRDGQQAD
ncbi:sigma-70 family RNA polymerase sigma factor [Xanthomonas campestris pv. zinniae]|nr:sigma-70 family RNA polymerase sigma factor [Xanthomonas campestris pv. zinniae]